MSKLLREVMTTGNRGDIGEIYRRHWRAFVFGMLAVSVSPLSLYPAWRESLNDKYEGLATRAFLILVLLWYPLLVAVFGRAAVVMLSGHRRFSEFVRKSFVLSHVMSLWPVLRLLAYGLFGAVLCVGVWFSFHGGPLSFIARIVLLLTLATVVDLMAVMGELLSPRAAEFQSHHTTSVIPDRDGRAETGLLTSRARNAISVVCMVLLGIGTVALFVTVSGDRRWSRKASDAARRLGNDHVTVQRMLERAKPYRIAFARGMRAFIPVWIICFAVFSLVNGAKELSSLDGAIVRTRSVEPPMTDKSPENH